MPGDDRNRRVDLRLANAGRHVLAGDRDPARVAERDRMSLRERLERRPVVERDALVQREPRERAVHRAGVEVVEPEPLGEPPGDGALARPGRAVDRDDHGSLHCR